MTAAHEGLALAADRDPVAQLKMNQAVMHCPQCGTRAVLERQPEQGQPRRPRVRPQATIAAARYASACSTCAAALTATITATPPTAAEQLQSVRETLDRVLQHGGRP